MVKKASSSTLCCGLLAASIGSMQSRCSSLAAADRGLVAPAKRSRKRRGSVGSASRSSSSLAILNHR